MFATRILFSGCIVTTLSLSFSAVNAATSSGTEAISEGTLTSPVWQSEAFVGTKFRNLTANSLLVTLDQTDGGFDSGIRGNYNSPIVDDVAEDYALDAKITVTGTGSGHWWAGPKLSVNWIPGNPNGSAGWYENYVVENSDRTPAWWHDFYDGEYIGSTWQDGAEYKHYLHPHSSWFQFFAIRQDYRDQGTVSIKPILNLWRNNGLPNNNLGQIRLNMETGKVNNRSFSFTDLCIPTSYTDGRCFDDGTGIVGDKRIVNVWQGTDLTYSTASTTLTNGPYNNWGSQNYIFELVSTNTYRIKVKWPGLYLQASSRDAWSNVLMSAKDETEPAQLWAVEETYDGSSKYRLRNLWSGFYLNTPQEDWKEVGQAPYNSTWTSLQYELVDY